MQTISRTTWEQVQLAASVGDLKDNHYQLLLNVSAMMELLVEKGILTREEIRRKAAFLDGDASAGDADAYLRFTSSHSVDRL